MSRFSTRQCSASHGKGVTEQFLHCYYPSLACTIPRFVSILAYLGRKVGHPTSLNELEARLQQIWNEMSQEIIQNFYASDISYVAKVVIFFVMNLYNYHTHLEEEYANYRKTPDGAIVRHNDESVRERYIRNGGKEVKLLITYGSPVWGAAAATHMKKIQVIQNKILRVMTNAPWYVRNDAIHNDLHMEPISNYITKLSRNVFKSIESHDNPIIKAQTLFTYPHPKIKYSYSSTKWRNPLRPP
ncbi:RNA-directed DNA polymerase from mobile element jockey [Trichonephila clavipes]|nr:RNA-directed DNA polymerase from mobile element jockey [Trichonephila clavipes]